MFKQKLVYAIIMVVCTLAFTSCENEEMDVVKEETSTVENSANAQELNTVQGNSINLFERRTNGYYIDNLPLTANIPYYHHLKQMSLVRNGKYPYVKYTCGLTSYLVARRAIDNSFPVPKEENVMNLHKWLYDTFSDYRKDPNHFASMYHIITFAQQVDNLTVRKCHKEARPLNGGGKQDINYNHPARTSFKRWLEGELRSKRVVICPGTWDFSVNGMGHYFIVIGLKKVNNELIIEYKDVLYNDNDDEVRTVSYTKFLNAIWYLNYNPAKKYSGGTYACSFYSGYSIQ